MRIFGPPAVDRLATETSARRLLKALAYDKDSGAVARAAAARLGVLKDPSTVEPLIEALQGGARSYPAAQALGQIGDSRATAPLVRLLRKGQPAQRVAAASALGQLGDRGAVGPLVEALDDRDEHVRVASQRALGKLGDPGTAEELWRALYHGDLVAQDESVRALLELRRGKGLDILVEALTSTESYWWDNPNYPGGDWVLASGRASSALVKAARGEHRQAVLNRLVAAQAGGDVATRLSVAGVLGEIGGRRAVSALTAALDDPDEGVRLAAAVALQKAGGPAHVR